jgi:hypothetical protein
MRKELLCEEPYSDDPAFGGYSTFFVSHPIYNHSYFMGNVTFEMLKQVFACNVEAKIGINRYQEFGKFIYDETIKPSGTYTFPELYHRIIGKEFSIKHYTDKVLSRFT